MSLPVFNESKMERFVSKDYYANFLFKGLHSGTKEERLEVVFNSVVLDDSQMTTSYENS